KKTQRELQYDKSARRGARTTIFSSGIFLVRPKLRRRPAKILRIFVIQPSEDGSTPSVPRSRKGLDGRSMRLAGGQPLARPVLPALRRCLNQLGFVFNEGRTAT